MKKLLSKFKYLFSFLVVMTMVFGIFPNEVDAKTPLPSWNKAIVTDNQNTTIDGRYTFIPKFNKNNPNKTVLWAGGAGATGDAGGDGAVWKEIRWGKGWGGHFQSFRIFDGNNMSFKGRKKGRAAVRYTNVGVYKGQMLDLRISIGDWDLNPNTVNGGNISFDKNAIAVSTSGFNSVELFWQFVETGTENLVTVDGYFTISDIDLYQGVDLSTDLLNSIDKIYIENSQNRLWHKTTSVWWDRISTDFAGDVDDDTFDSRNAFTFTFSNNTLRFNWMTDWTHRPPNNTYDYADKGNAAGEYFFYSNIKPARFDVTPSKVVNHSYINFTKDSHKDLVYDVYFDVPFETRDTYYKSLVLTDSVDSILDVKSVRVYEGDSSKNVSSRFNISINGSDVKAQMKPEQIRWENNYDTDYRLEITTSIDEGRLDKKYAILNSKKYFARNKAQLVIDGRLTRSNEVDTEIVKSDVPPPIIEEDKPGDCKLRVDHRDVRDDMLIATKTSFIKKGTWYNENRRTDLTTFSGDEYIFIKGEPDDTPFQSGRLNNDLTLTFYYRVRETVKPERLSLRIHHIDEDTNQILDVSGRYVYEGTPYSESRKTNLTNSNGDKYMFTRGEPVDSATQSGRVYSDTLLRFYYKVDEPEPVYHRLRVEHIDDESGEILANSSRYMEEGSYYSESRRTNLTNFEGGQYVFSRATPVNSYNQSGRLNKDMTLRFYYRVKRYGLTIRHVDSESNTDIVPPITRTVKDGSSYYETSRTGLRRYDGYNYKSLAPKVRQGKVTGDTELIFYYRVPKLTIKNEGIHIYTDKSYGNSTQPVVLFSDSRIKNSGDSLGDFTGARVRLRVRDRDNNRLLYDETESINYIFARGEIPFNMKNGYLGKDSKTNYSYEIDIISVGNNNYELVTSQPSVNTRGYTSSEKVLKNSDRDGSGVINYDHVVLTEASPGRSIKEYSESVWIGNIDKPRLKSGYGYEFNPHIKYSIDANLSTINRIKGKVPSKDSFKPLMDIDEEIVDLNDGYLNSHINDGKVSINLDITHNNVSKGKSDIRYQLPKAYLDRDDGRIWYSALGGRRVDAGNKMYVPIWIGGLGKYDARLNSTVNVGSNLISLDVENDVDIYAYMLSHTDSETPDSELDELLLHPMDKDDDLFNWNP